MSLQAQSAIGLVAIPLFAWLVSERRTGAGPARLARLILVGLGLQLAVAGIMLIRIERAVWGPRLLFSLQSGANPLTSLFASGRILLAGGLLVFPGFISDAIALVLLLIPGTWAGRKADPMHPANDDVLEGEFKREPDDLLR